VRAAVYYGRGDVRVEQVDAPGRPGPGELLLDVSRAAICGTDASEYASGPKMVPLEREHPQSRHVGPMVLGHEFTGSVRAVGEGVTGFTAGDRVVCGAGVSCGECDWCRAGRTNLCARYYTLGLHTHGGLAEAVLAPAAICALVPDGCSDDAAAMAQPLAVGLHVLNRGAVTGSDSVTVIGVGGIGAMVLGGAAARGVTELIAVDVDEARLATASAIGAQVCIDARHEDVPAAIRQATGGEGADVIIECSGRPESPGTALDAVRRGGRLVIVGLQAEPVPLDLWQLVMQEVQMTTAMAHVCGSDLPEAIEILATTELARHVLDRVIPLDLVVDEGLVRLVERRAKGKIVIDTTRRAG
jgi:(R,R)-butanediol dehydrogenase / meso-butanediol dehydrogenase / diacetyl reductase